MRSANHLHQRPAALPRVVAELRNCRVVLDDAHPRSKDVQPGETWHVRIRDRFLYLIAEPIQRIQAPETDEKT